jgi:hypothetical protein
MSGLDAHDAIGEGVEVGIDGEVREADRGL